MRIQMAIDDFGTTAVKFDNNEIISQHANYEAGDKFITQLRDWAVEEGHDVSLAYNW
jgi:D-aminopeptidase